MSQLSCLFRRHDWQPQKNSEDLPPADRQTFALGGSMHTRFTEPDGRTGNLEIAPYTVTCRRCGQPPDPKARYVRTYVYDPTWMEDGDYIDATTDAHGTGYTTGT